MQRIVKYFRNVVAEMKMVSWPNRKDVVSATILVMVFAIIMAMVVWGIDQVIAVAMGLIVG